VSRWLARLILVILLVEIGLSVNGAILGVIGASVAELFVTRLYPHPPIFARSTFPIRLLFGTMAPLFLTALSTRLLRIDLFMLKALGGDAADAGIYGAAQNVSFVPGLLGLAASGLLLSTLTRVIRNGDEPLAKKISRNNQRLILGLLPFAGMTAGMSTEIATLIFGSSYSAAGPIISRLIFAAIAIMMINSVTSVIAAYGRPKLTSALTLPLVPLAIAAHIVLIPRQGDIAAANVTLGVTALGAVAGMAALRALHGVGAPLATLIRSAILAIGAFIIADFFPVSGLWVGLKAIGIAIVILLGLVALGEVSRQELRSLLEIATMKKSKETMSDGEV
jgi:O-antigen/teichoic acid export membrane protein